ncbi:MAG: LacI family DNA-binding transcriptional regulator [Victivallales bacterium]|nr:LacI family DNA-binding transcriptional regulator [Victivallales bacterium]
MSNRASITDVAKHAGVSISTVSLVMNNRPNVAPATARAVREAARELNYQPGGGPGKKRGPKPGPRRNIISRQMGIVLGGYPDAVLRDGVCTALVQGAARICGAEGFQAVPVIAADPEQVRAMIRHSRFDGLLAIGQPSGERLTELLSRTPTVQLLGSPPDPLTWDHVGFDGLEAARHVCETLVASSCKTCWYLGMERFVYAQFAECMEVECHHFGLDFRSLTSRDYFRSELHGPALDCHAIARDLPALMADPGTGPIGVFAENTALALVLQTHLLSASQPVASPISAIVSDTFPCGVRGLDVFRGFMDLHIRDIARQGVDQLLWRVNHRNEPRVRRLVSVSVADGAETAKADET